MNRILLIVEGEVREKTFFDRYKCVKKMETNLDIVPFHQNIRELYRICKEYIFNGIKPDNILDIIINSNINIDDKSVLEGLFTDVYLVFDFDIQNAKSKEKMELYFEEIKELVRFFDDSTTIGQIMINYPMMDSIYHITDSHFNSYRDIAISSSIECNKHYKEYLYKEKRTYDCSKLTKNDFDMLSAINLKKANYIVNNNYSKADFTTYEHTLNQSSLLEAQLNNIHNNNFIYVLNSSVFIDVDLYGKALYFHERGNRLFEDETLINSLKNK